MRRLLIFGLVVLNLALVAASIASRSASASSAKRLWPCCRGDGIMAYCCADCCWLPWGCSDCLPN